MMSKALLVLFCLVCQAQTKVTTKQLKNSTLGGTRITFPQAFILCKAGQLRADSANKTEFFLNGVWQPAYYVVGLGNNGPCAITTHRVIVRPFLFTGNLVISVPELTTPEKVFTVIANPPEGQTTQPILLLNDEWVAVTGSLTLRPKRPIPLGSRMIVEWTVD